MPALTVVPKYRKFINDRDKALEKMLQNTLKRVSDISHGSFKNILSSITVSYGAINDHNRFTSHARRILDALYATIDGEMRMLAHLLDRPIYDLRRAATTLAYAGELEAISRVVQVTSGQKNIARSPMVSTIADGAKCFAALTKIQGKIRDEIERGYVQAIPLDLVLKKVKTHLPKVLRYKKPPRELAPLKEAFTEEWAQDATLDFISEEDWRNVVSLYKDEYVSKARDLAFDVEIGEPEAEEWYGWEIEQNIVHDFLYAVRDGGETAAEQAGIDDLLWVAILDDHTRPEHRLKSGLTSSEIEAKLDDEWADFDDQGTVAPSGFKCRCRSTPYVKDLPEVEPVNYKDFDEWLTS
jgi:hypothetical protein